MWKCIFDSETNIGVAFNRAPGPGEYQRLIKPSDGGTFNQTPSRYRYDNGLVEREGWEAELEAARLVAWREKTHCGPLQLRRALRASGLLDSVKSYLETADEEVIEAWEYATKVNRNDPFVLAVGQLLNKTEEEIDALFQLALTYP